MVGIIHLNREKYIPTASIIDKNIDVRK